VVFHSGKPGGTTEGSSEGPPNIVGPVFDSSTASSIAAACLVARPPLEAISR